MAADVQPSGLPTQSSVSSNDVFIVQNGSTGTVAQVTADKILYAGAIKLGYASITSDFTTANQAAQAVTGLTASVQIPSTGRSTKITAVATNSGINASGSNAVLTIWDGTVGTGTQIGYSSGTIDAANGTVPLIAMAVVSPAAGTKTYNVGFHVSSNTGTVRASATAPAFILVEAI